MPHFGHFPGLSEITSGCIEQVYFWATGEAAGAGLVSLPLWAMAGSAAKAKMAARVKMMLVFMMICVVVKYDTASDGNP